MPQQIAKIGDWVRTKKGYEDTVEAGYEGEITHLRGTSVTVSVRKLPSGFELAPYQTMELHTVLHKLEVVER